MFKTDDDDNNKQTSKFNVIENCRMNRFFFWEGEINALQQCITKHKFLYLIGVTSVTAIHSFIQSSIYCAQTTFNFRCI